MNKSNHARCINDVVDRLVSKIETSQKIRARIPRSPWVDDRPSVDKGIIATERAFLEPMREQFIQLGFSAVPRLLHHLRSGIRDRESVAFYGLQFCWNDQAQEPVSRFLAHEDGELRLMAAIVLITHLGAETLARLCEPLLEDDRAHVAGFAFEQADSGNPNMERMSRFLKQPEFYPFIWKQLPRYQTRDFTFDTLRLLESEGLAHRLAAIASLIHQHADAIEIRNRMLSLLRHETPALREMAAEYLTWHGTINELPGITAHQSTENDLFVSAALDVAQDAIARRHRKFGSLLQGSGQSIPISDDPLNGSIDRYRILAESLAHEPDKRTFEKAIHFYRNAEPFEPRFVWQGSSIPESFTAMRQARLALQGQLYGIPLSLENMPSESVKSPVPPTFDKMVPPTRFFFDSNRSSFGLHISNIQTQAFGGLVHIGDDVAYDCIHQAVVAIASGIVRYAGCTPSWGFMVVIEHQDQNEQKFCSLYAHLSPFVTVVSGQQVTAGQKIGTIGRGNCWENGGYLTHLHFGIHLGPYIKQYRHGENVDIRFNGKTYRGTVIETSTQGPIVRFSTGARSKKLRRTPSWVCGYISKEGWNEGGDGWLDPQQVIQHNAIHVKKEKTL